VHRKPLAHEKTEAALREMFLGMRSAQPVRVPSERALAERVGVSRVTLRRAMARLVAEGMLQQRQGTGTYVMPVTPAFARELQLLRSPFVKPEDPFHLKLLTALSGYAANAGLRLVLLEAKPEEADGQALPPPLRGDEPLVRGDEPLVRGDEPLVRGDEPLVRGDEPLMRGDEPLVRGDEPLVVIGPVGAAFAERLRASHSRIIAIHGGDSLSQASEVRFDDRHIGRQAFAILHGRGFRHLALLAGPERYDSAAERRHGFVEAAARQAVTVTVLEEKMNWGGGVRAAERLLPAIGTPEFPQAVFAANDWMALGLMQRMKEAGVDIPGDLSVLGCDNIPLASEFTPPLATFELGVDRLVLELDDMLRRDPSQQHARRILLPAAFVPRASLKGGAGG
jgi:hypothetical protein